MKPYATLSTTYRWRRHSPDLVGECLSVCPLLQGLSRATSALIRQQHDTANEGSPLSPVICCQDSSTSTHHGARAYRWPGGCEKTSPPATSSAPTAATPASRDPRAGP